MIKKIILFTKLFVWMNLTNLYAEGSHEKLLNILQNNFPAEIVFEQISDDSEAEGWMIITGKGRARTEFSPPNNFLIVADGEWVIFHDTDTSRTTYLPLRTGILQALLDPSAFKDKKEFKVKERKSKNKITFSVEFNLENNNQKVLIYFDDTSKNLLGWQIFENNNEQINIKVLKFKKISDENLLERNLFKLTNKMIEEGVTFYGPYKRKVKRLLKNK